MSKAKIMIVEDEALIAMELKDRLELQDYSVCGTMARAEEAIEQAGELQPDLMLMDIHLAGEMSGIEAARKMKEKGIPVIYLTAYSSQEMVSQAAHTEPYGFLVKPFNETELRATVETALYKHAMEQKVRASEARLAEAQRIAHIGNWDWDVAKNELYWSDEIYRIFGVEPREFGATYEAFLSFVHPDDREYVDRSVQEAFAAKIAYNIEHRVIRPGGDIRYVQEQARVFRDRQGRAIRMAGTVQDITKRKTAEAEQTRLLQILESSLNEIYIFDAESLRFEYVNRGALQNLGYGLKEMKEMTPIDLKPGFNEASFRQVFLEPLLRREKEVNVTETIHRRADGSTYPVEVHLQLFEFQGKSVFMAVIVDTTERKIAEEMSRKASRQVEEILESITDAFAAVDKEARIIYVNDQAVKLWRHSREELLGKSIWMIFPDAMGTPFHEMTMRALERSEQIHFEEFYPPYRAWFEVDLYPTPEGSSIFFRDVTARRLAQEERESLVEELQKALANVKTLSAMLPICSSCKKIRDDQGYWSQIEEYVRKHTDTQFSHGICPDCVRVLYPEVADSVEAKLREAQTKEKKK